MTIDKKSALNDDRIESCFKMFDVNNDGMISLQEFQNMLQGNQKVTTNVWKDLMKDVTGNQD